MNHGPDFFPQSLGPDFPPPQGHVGAFRVDPAWGWSADGFGVCTGPRAEEGARQADPCPRGRVIEEPGMEAWTASPRGQRPASGA